MSKINRHPVRRTAAGVLASALALSGAVAAATPANALPSFGLDRIEGANRYETSARIATAFGPTTTAILASGEQGRTVDALSANFLAGVREAPVLLTTRNRIPAPVRTVLNTLTGARNVIIVGGEVAVSAAVETELRTAGFTVTRLGGVDRYATSEAIINEGRASANRIAIVASGTNFPDALAGGPLAYKGKHPVILTSGGTLPQDSIDALVAAGTTSVVILGGLNAVPASVETQLRARNITIVERLGGADRSETSRLIADFLINTQQFTNTTFDVASGDPRGSGADALSGAALSGKRNRALLITNTPNSAAPVIAFATARAATLNAVGTIYGGPAAVTADLEARIEAAGRTSPGPVALTASTVAQGGSLTGTITGDFSSVTVSGCGFTNQTIGADDNATTAGRQFTLNVGAGQATGDCTLTFTATPTGGGAAVTQTVQVNVTARPAGATVTARPELASASIVQTTSLGTTVRYVFDEALTGSLASQSGFHVLTFESNGVAGRFNSATAEIDPANTRSVLATFTGITQASDAARLSVATVDAGVVTGNLQNVSDTNPAGDAPLNAGTTSNLAAGVTSAPDLVSVGNFRSNPGNTSQTLVDYTFDAAADVGAATGFHVVATGGTTAGDLTGTAISGGGTATITVAFDNSTTTGALTAAQFSRGYVETGTVNPAGTATTPVNPLQAADISASGNTDTPDLVSAEIRRGVNVGGGVLRDQILYTFDEPVAVGTTAANDPTTIGTDESALGVGSLFRAYLSNGSEVFGQSNAAGVSTAPNAVGPARSTTNENQVLVTFGAGTDALSLAVGASVEEGAVTELTGTLGATGRANQEDEVGVTNVGTGSTTVSGRTAAPDLTAVAVERITDPFGALTGSRVRYTFDDDVVVLDSTRFSIVLSDGTTFACSQANVAAGTTEDTDNQVTCTSFANLTATATNTQVLSGVLGSVEDGAVADQAADTGPGTSPAVAATAGTDRNPEGAEAATGTTGTPQQ